MQSARYYSKARYTLPGTIKYRKYARYRCQTTSADHRWLANTPVHSLTPSFANTGHHRAVSYVSPVMNPDIGQHGRGIITFGPSRFAIPSDPKTLETIGIT